MTNVLSQSPKPDTSPESRLGRAIRETGRLEAELRELCRQDYQLASMRNRTDLKDYESFHHQRKELFAKIAFTQADIKRSKATEELIRRQIAEAASIPLTLVEAGAA